MSSATIPAATRPVYYFGIDPGVNTGIALWDSLERKFLFIKTVMIHQAMDIILSYQHGIKLVKLEDSRGKFGHRDPNRAQGAGSIKRDCKIWEDFLTEKQIPFAFRKFTGRNLGYTKMKQEPFKKLTSWQLPTNDHGRDAAMLVYDIV